MQPKSGHPTPGGWQPGSGWTNPVRQRTRATGRATSPEEAAASVISRGLPESLRRVLPQSRHRRGHRSALRGPLPGVREGARKFTVDMTAVVCDVMSANSGEHVKGGPRVGILQENAGYGVASFLDELREKIVEYGAETGAPPTQIRVHPSVYTLMKNVKHRETSRGLPLLALGVELLPDAGVGLTRPRYQDFADPPSPTAVQSPDSEGN